FCGRFRRPPSIFGDSAAPPGPSRAGDSRRDAGPAVRPPTPPEAHAMTLPDLHGVPQPTPTPAAATPASEEAPPRKALFDKAQRFLDPAGDYVQVKAADLYPYFRPIEVSEGSRAVMHGREVIMAGSNNCLGLTNHPKVVEAAQAAIAKYGTGCTGSRFLNGTLDLHLELEDRLARFMGKEGCVLFSTGYMTNQGVIQSLAGKGDLVF